MELSVSGVLVEVCSITHIFNHQISSADALGKAGSGPGKPLKPISKVLMTQQTPEHWIFQWNWF